MLFVKRMQRINSQLFYIYTYISSSVKSVETKCFCLRKSHYFTQKDIAPIDPKIDAVKDKLIYCEYLEYDRMRFGYKKLSRMKKIIEENKMKEKNNAQVFSILLNQLPKDVDWNENLEENLKDNEKIIHMPYADTDKYRLVNKNDKTSKLNNLAENTVTIDKRYKDLYEKYLSVTNYSKDSSKLSFTEFESSSSMNSNNDLFTDSAYWMTDYECYNDAQTLPNDLLHGTAKSNSNVSDIPCGGCGALLHCKDPELPGYLPSELFSKRQDKELKNMICQRCHFMKNYNTALNVKVSIDEYPELLKIIKKKICCIILMIDLTDFPCSIWPELSSILHPYTQIFVVGNKVDLLPRDSSQFFIHVKDCLLNAVKAIGVNKNNIKEVSLISAKTGYGVEQFINTLYKHWKYKGDVYLVGCTNVGKSSLFNALLQSDYCKAQASDLIQRATVSSWPGTTLNLLKFPILNPVKWKRYERTVRLINERQQKILEEQHQMDCFKETRQLKHATLQGYIGKTFVKSRNKPESFGLNETLPEYQRCRWCYDTPGTIQKDQILDLLTIEELFKTLPDQIISPRTFIIYPNQTIFLAGLGRLDYIEGNHFMRCTVFASRKLPITMCHTVDANYIYKELLRTEAFSVPMNMEHRLKLWPSLESKEMEVIGIHYHESVADVVLSSAGWIAITPSQNQVVKLRAWTPNARGIYLRTPALLKKSVSFRGARVPKTPAYEKGRQIYYAN